VWPGRNLPGIIDRPEKAAEDRIPHLVAQEFETVPSRLKILFVAISIVVESRKEPHGPRLHHQYFVRRSKPSALPIVVEAEPSSGIKCFRIPEGHDILIEHSLKPNL